MGAVGVSPAALARSAASAIEMAAIAVRSPGEMAQNAVGQMRCIIANYSVWNPTGKMLAFGLV